MVALGNFLYRTRLYVFPAACLLVFLPGPRIWQEDLVAAFLGLAIALTGQLIRAGTIGLVYIVRGGKIVQITKDQSLVQRLIDAGELTPEEAEVSERRNIILQALGTAAEVSSVNSVDDRSIPCPGPKTKAIADVYARAVRGQEDRYKDWCELAV